MDKSKIGTILEYSHGYYKVLADDGEILYLVPWQIDSSIRTNKPIELVGYKGKLEFRKGPSYSLWYLTSIN